MTQATGPLPTKLERVRLSLSANEFSQLVEVCETQLRSVSDQIRYIVREYLKQRQAPPIPVPGSVRIMSSGGPCQLAMMGYCPEVCDSDSRCPPNVTKKDIAAAEAYTCQCGETDPAKIIPAIAHGPSSAPYATGNDYFLHCDTCHVWAACSGYLWDAYVLRKETHESSTTRTD